MNSSHNNLYVLCVTLYDSWDIFYDFFITHYGSCATPYGSCVIFWFLYYSSWLMWYSLWFLCYSLWLLFYSLWSLCYLLYFMWYTFWILWYSLSDIDRLELTFIRTLNIIRIFSIKEVISYLFFIKSITISQNTNTIIKIKGITETEIEWELSVWGSNLSSFTVAVCYYSWVHKVGKMDWGSKRIHIDYWVTNRRINKQRSSKVLYLLVLWFGTTQDIIIAIGIWEYSLISQ